MCEIYGSYFPETVVFHLYERVRSVFKRTTVGIITMLMRESTIWSVLHLIERSSPGHFTHPFLSSTLSTPVASCVCLSRHTNVCNGSTICHDLPFVCEQHAARSTQHLHVQVACLRVVSRNVCMFKCI